MRFTSPATRSPELAYSQILATQLAISGTGDITGLSITFTAPVEPVWAELWLPAVRQNTSAATALFYITDSANNAVAFASHDLAIAGVAGPIIVKRRITILTPGTPYTFKGRAQTTAGTVDVRAGADAIPTVNGPAYLRAYREL